MPKLVDQATEPSSHSPLDQVCDGPVVLDPATQRPSPHIAAQRNDRQRQVPFHWRVTAASEAGVAHAKSGLPCQDAHASRQSRDGWLAVAVADGAGSASRSQDGARIAVETAVLELSIRLRRLPHSPQFSPSQLNALLSEAIQRCRVAVQWRGRELGIATRDLASTLIVALIGPQQIAAAQIGDGGVIVEHTDGQIETVLEPDSGEYLNETTFLTSQSALEHLQFTELDRQVKSVAVITDGLQMLALRYPDWQPFRPFFGPVFDFVHGERNQQRATEAVQQMLQSEAVRSRTHDDVTLLVASREE